MALSPGDCTALERSPLGCGWVELYHSAPHWPDAVIIYRPTPTSAPLTRRLIPDPTHAGFRVVRLRLAPAAAAAAAAAAAERRGPFPPPGDSPGDTGIGSSCSHPDGTWPAPPDLLRFRLRPSTKESAHGGGGHATPGDAHVYAVPAVAGRYVVTTGLPTPARVSAPDVAACLRLYRPSDAYVELVFRPPPHRWPRQAPSRDRRDRHAATTPACFVAYAHHASTDRAAEWPRQAMQRMAAADTAAAVIYPRARDDGRGAKTGILDGHRSSRSSSHSAAVSAEHARGPCEEVVAQTHEDDEQQQDQAVPTWFCRFASDGLDCVFTDGENSWDNNRGGHYVVPMPGRYLVENECIRYLGPSELDRHLHPL